MNYVILVSQSVSWSTHGKEMGQ